MGITEEDFDKIFEIFKKYSESINYPEGDIGLAIVNKIINKFEISINVESMLSKGSVFYVNLPKDQNK